MAAIQATRMKRDGFTETGAGALSLVAEKEETNTVSGSLGVRMRKEFSLTERDIAPEFSAQQDGRMVFQAMITP
jgi:hypothetical protein